MKKYENSSYFVVLCEDVAHHLRELATMTPLSMEKLSRGRPAIFQAWILMGSPRTLVSENFCEHGNFFS